MACLVVGLLHIGLLVVGRGPVIVSAAHAIMGLGMAAMFAPTADPIPHPVWVAIFVLVAAGFGAAALHAGSLLGEPGHHSVGAAAMVFMLLGHDRGPARPAAGSADLEPAHHAGAAGAGSGLDILLTVVALAFVTWFIADIARCLAPAGPVDARSGGSASGSATQNATALAAVVPAAAGTVVATPDAVDSTIYR